MRLLTGLLIAAAGWAQGVEFIGLEETTQKWAEGHLERLPDGRIHYCADDLKQAGYADASVVIHIGTDNTMFTVVTVVEAKRAAEVQQRPRPDGDVAKPAEWTYDTAVAVLNEASDWVWTVPWSVDGKWIASGSSDQKVRI